MKQLQYGRSRVALAILLLGVGCGGGEEPPSSGAGGAGKAGQGGAASGGGVGVGSGGGTGHGGQSAAGGAGAGGSGGGSGQSNGGSDGRAGAPGVGGAAGTGTADSGAPADGGDAGGAASDAGGAAPGPTTPGQGPTALGRIVYSNDFENGMEGMERSPRGIPVDRVQILDDPLGQRGKVMRIVWQAGDNFRTSAGTEPRSWLSNRPGHEFTPGKKVSHAFGFMTTSASMNFAFGQVISSNGPVWMTLGGGNGELRIFCRPCGGNSTHMQLVPNRWYDFRIEMDYRVGGTIEFFVDGQMFTQRRIESTRGTIAHWDGGIYNRPEGTASNRTRTVYISNLSVGEK